MNPAMKEEYTVVNDTIAFCNMLGANYGIAMHQVQKPGCYSYVGEYYTLRGTPLRITINVYPVKTEIRVISMSKECLFQKAYSTQNDKTALTKSVGLQNFIEKSIQKN